MTSELTDLQPHELFTRRQKVRRQFLQGPVNFGHWFNFSVWKKAIKIRYFTEGLVVLFFAIYTQYTCNNFVDSYKGVIPIFQSFSAIMTTLTDPNASDEARAEA